MRTTLTLEEDLAARLHDLARRTGRSFKQVVNDAIRRGLSAGPKPGEGPRPFQVKPKACGFRAGIDIGKLNQLVDDLEIEAFGERIVRDAGDR